MKRLILCILIFAGVAVAQKPTPTPPTPAPVVKPTPPVRPPQLDPQTRQHQNLAAQIANLTAIAADPAKSQAYVKQQIAAAQAQSDGLDQRVAERNFEACMATKHDMTQCPMTKPVWSTAK